MRERCGRTACAPHSTSSKSGENRGRSRRSTLTESGPSPHPVPPRISSCPDLFRAFPALPPAGHMVAGMSGSSPGAPGRGRTEAGPSSHSTSAESGANGDRSRRLALTVSGGKRPVCCSQPRREAATKPDWGTGARRIRLRRTPAETGAVRNARPPFGVAPAGAQRRAGASRNRSDAAWRSRIVAGAPSGTTKEVYRFLPIAAGMSPKLNPRPQSRMKCGMKQASSVVMAPPDMHPVISPRSYKSTSSRHPGTDRSVCLSLPISTTRSAGLPSEYNSRSNEGWLPKPGEQAGPFVERWLQRPGASRAARGRAVLQDRPCS